MNRDDSIKTLKGFPNLPATIQDKSILKLKKTGQKYILEKKTVTKTSSWSLIRNMLRKEIVKIPLVRCFRRSYER